MWERGDSRDRVPCHVNNNNVNNDWAARPALPDCQKNISGEVFPCIGQRNPIPFCVEGRKYPHRKTHAVGRVKLGRGYIRQKDFHFYGGAAEPLRPGSAGKRDNVRGNGI